MPFHNIMKSTVSPWDVNHPFDQHILTVDTTHTLVTEHIKVI